MILTVVTVIFSGNANRLQHSGNRRMAGAIARAIPAKRIGATRPPRLFIGTSGGRFSNDSSRIANVRIPFAAGDSRLQLTVDVLSYFDLPACISSASEMHAAPPNRGNTH